MNKKYIIIASLALLLGAAGQVTAQPVGGMTSAKRLQIAEAKYQQGDLYNAMEWYNKAYDDAPENLDIIAKLANIQYQLRDYKLAEKWYIKLFMADKAKKYPEAGFYLARSLKMNGKYDEAAAEFQKFINAYNGSDTRLKKLAVNEMLGAELAREMQPVPGVNVANAGGKVNSPFSEFGAMPIDGNTFYYGAIRSDSIIVLEEGRSDYFAKVFRSTRNGNDFTQGELVQGINKTGFHTGNVTISTDKNTLYYTRCTLNGNALSHCDIFQSKGSDGNWNEGTIITGINGSDFTVKHPAYGKKNGKDGLYFASNQAGGQGGWDLYFAPKLADGSFGQSENLGNKINTIGNEETPFYKNGVLHFSSDGHPTIGGYDVFEASETGSGFTDPKNMGVGVNSYVDDMYYTVSEDNWRGFLVSNRPGTTSLKSETCCDDIFAVKLPFTADINVTTFDAEKQNPLSGVTVKLIELTGNIRQNKANPTANTFDFVLLPTEKRYRLVASRSGYFSDSTELSTLGLLEPKNLSARLNLKAIPVPPPPPPPPPPPVRPTIALHNIYWDFNKAIVRGDAALSLDTVARVLAENADLVVEVASHTDALGANSYNKILAEKRTKAATEYLKSRGVDPSRLLEGVYGEESPVAPNQLENGKDNPDGRQLNRRTEFRIVRRVGAVETTPSSIKTTAAAANPMPIMTFSKTEHDFGQAKAGKKLLTTFDFTNTGTKDLVIEFASASCECTKVEEYPRGKAIAPGAKGQIKVSYDTKDKVPGKDGGEVTLLANTLSPMVLKVRCEVIN